MYVLPAPSRFIELAGAIELPALGQLLDGCALGLAPERHIEARQAVLDGWQMVFPGQTPTLEQVQAIQAIGAHEGQYGRGWPDHPSPITGLMTSMNSCNNWGAIQCQNCKPVDGQCCDGCGYWYDSRPTSSGQQYFEQCFKCYATPAEGAAGIIRFLAKGYKNVMDVLPSGNLDEIAWQMRLGNYFQGFTTDKREAARQYAGALDKRAAEIAAALGEPQVARRKGEGVLTSGGTPIAGGAQLARVVGLGLAAGVVVTAVVAPGALVAGLGALGGAILTGASAVGSLVGSVAQSAARKVRA